jgi:hypothetical protein
MKFSENLKNINTQTLVVMNSILDACGYSSNEEVSSDELEEGEIDEGNEELVMTRQQLNDLVNKKVREGVREIQLKSRRPRRSHRTVPYRPRPPQQQGRGGGVSFFEAFVRDYWCKCNDPSCERAVHSSFDISENQLKNYVFTNNGARISHNNTWANRTRTLLRMCKPGVRKDFIYFLMNHKIS